MGSASSLARITIVGIFVAGGLSVSTPVAAHLFDAGQRRHVVDCLFWLLTDPAAQAANCQGRATPMETAGSGGAASRAGFEPARSGAGDGDANTAEVSGGSNTGSFNSGDNNTGTYSPGANTGSVNNGDQNTGVYDPGQNTGSFNDGSNNTGSYN